MGLYSGPSAPDPAQTAAAQFNYNQGASVSSGILNNPNINSPFGNVNYTKAGEETVTLPDGRKISVPRYTQNVELGEAEAAQKAQRDRIMKELLGGEPDGAEAYQTTSGTQAFDTPDSFSEDRRRVENAMMERSGELLGKNRDSEVARLAAMGLAPGGEKYGRVADQFERSSNDLALGSILAGGQEQSRQLNESRAFTSAENARRQDSATFQNSTRQSMVNELLAILSGGQISSPGQPAYQGQAVAAPDYAGLVQKNYEQEVGKYNNKMAGLTSILTAGMGM